MEGRKIHPVDSQVEEEKRRMGTDRLEGVEENEKRKKTCKLVEDNDAIEIQYYSPVFMVLFPYKYYYRVNYLEKIYENIS